MNSLKYFVLTKIFLFSMPVIAMVFEKGDTLSPHLIDRPLIFKGKIHIIEGTTVIEAKNKDVTIVIDENATIEGQGKDLSTLIFKTAPGKTIYLVGSTKTQNSLIFFNLTLNFNIDLSKHHEAFVASKYTSVRFLMGNTSVLYPNEETERLLKGFITGERPHIGRRD